MTDKIKFPIRSIQYHKGTGCYYLTLPKGAGFVPGDRVEVSAPDGDTLVLKRIRVGR